MQPMQPAQQGHPVWRYGLIFGGIIGLLEIINFVISVSSRGGASAALAGASSQTAVTSGLFGIGCLFFLIGLALYFVAGMLAAGQTGRVGTGSLAGLVAGAVGGLVALIAGVITLATLPLSYFQSIADQTQTSGGTQLTGQQIQSAAVVFGIIVYVIVWLFYIGVGAGIGALGGLAGRGRAPRPQYSEAMYQGMGQGYPPAPGYPPQPQGGYPQPGQYPPPQGYPQQPGQYPPPPPPPQQ